MIYDVLFTRVAEHDFDRLSADDQRRVDDAITQLATAEIGNVRRLTDRGDELRLRVGALRVRFFIDHEAGRVIISHILPRDRAYRE